MRHHGSQKSNKECFFCSSKKDLKILPIENRGMRPVCPDCIDLTAIYLDADYE